MDGEALSLVREVFDHLDDTVPRGGLEATTRARELFAHLDRPGGRVEAIDEPESFRTPIADLGNWSEDPWGEPTYAIDSSTTRPFEYTNGLITDTAYAKLGVGGTDVDRSPERAGTIKTVAYYDDEEASLYNETFAEPGPNPDSLLTAELVPFEADTTRTRTLSKAVSAVAQYLAEGEHARRHLDAIDGVLFLDGSLYPLGVLYWLLLDHIGETSPASSWDRPREIVTNYLEVIDRQYERGLPVVGIVKTSTTAQMVDALETKIKRHDITDEDGLRPEVPWMRDHNSSPKSCVRRTSMGSPTPRGSSVPGSEWGRATPNSSIRLPTASNTAHPISTAGRSFSSACRVRSSSFALRPRCCS